MIMKIKCSNSDCGKVHEAEVTWGRIVMIKFICVCGKVNEAKNG